MSEMKERIANVINRHKNTHDEPALARMILETMREPSQAQHQAFAKTLDWMSDTPLGHQQREAWKEENVQRWQLMVDAALKTDA